MKLKINKKNIIVLIALLAMVIYAGGTMLMAEDAGVANSDEKLCQCPTCIESRAKDHDGREEADHDEEGHDEHDECDGHDEDGYGGREDGNAVARGLVRLRLQG